MRRQPQDRVAIALAGAAHEAQPVAHLRRCDCCSPHLDAAIAEFDAAGFEGLDYGDKRSLVENSLATFEFSDGGGRDARRFGEFLLLHAN